MNITNLTTSQLTQIIALKEQIEALEQQIDSIVADDGSEPHAGGKRMQGIGDHADDSFDDAFPRARFAIIRRRRKLSAAGRARIAAAQKARWAKVHGATNVGQEPVKLKRKLSAAHKRKLIKALAKARKVRLANLKAAAPEPAKKRKMSAAAKAKLSAAAKARWAARKAEGKTTL